MSTETLARITRIVLALQEPSDEDCDTIYVMLKELAYAPVKSRFFVPRKQEFSYPEAKYVCMVAGHTEVYVYNEGKQVISGHSVSWLTVIENLGSGAWQEVTQEYVDRMLSFRYPRHFVPGDGESWTQTVFITLQDPATAVWHYVDGRTAPRKYDFKATDEKIRAGKWKEVSLDVARMRDEVVYPGSLVNVVCDTLTPDGLTVQAGQYKVKAVSRNAGFFFIASAEDGKPEAVLLVSKDVLRKVKKLYNTDKPG